MSEPGLRILALDGGGVSVYSELQIVRELMIRIGGAETQPPRPCDCFDLIGGTGGGGLVAILLGRLQLDIDTAIGYWLKVMRVAFSRQNWYPWEDAFSGTMLEQVMDEIVEERCRSKEEPMMEAEGNNNCKVVVYALTADAIRGGIPTSIRNYRVRGNQDLECTIVEAARATMANPGIFQPKIINQGGVDVPYVGGDLVCNNPTARLLTEVGLAYPGRSISSVISVGSGQLRPSRITDELKGYILPVSAKLVSALKTIAEDCERIHQEVRTRFPRRTAGGPGPCYSRFNVGQGMQFIDQYSPAQIKDALQHTQNYLKEGEPDERMDDAVAIIRGGGAGTVMVQGGSVFMVGLVDDSGVHRAQLAITNGEDQGSCTHNSLSLRTQQMLSRVD